MVCCFFGHNSTPVKVESILRAEIIKLVNSNRNIQFYVGNSGNFDSIVYNTLRKLKQQYPHICYSVVLAYMPKKTDGFNSDKTYENTIYPDGLESVPKRFAISVRNKWMIERADMVICYKTHNGGGAAQFISMAEKKGKTIVNLADSNI